MQPAESSNTAVKKVIRYPTNFFYRDILSFLISDKINTSAKNSGVRELHELHELHELIVACVLLHIWALLSCLENKRRIFL